METILLTAKNKTDLKALVDLAKRLGMKTRALSKAEVEDFALAKKIDKGLKTQSVSKETILHALRK